MFAMNGKADASDYQETVRMLGARRGFEKPVSVEVLLKAVRLAVG